MNTSIEPGTLLNSRYRVEARLAAGATSEVYVGRDENLDRPVALKVLRGETADRRRFASEVRVLAALDHPNLVRVYDAIDEPHLAVLIMELVDGPSLAQSLHDAPLADGAVQRLGSDLSGCVAYLHDRGVVHRDIKPGNILVGADGRARLADFGIARLIDGTRLTQTGQAIGTLSYMAPEQLTGDPTGPPADIYALGLVMLEALTGQRAFAGSGNEAVAARLARDPDVPGDLPQIWQALLPQMTARRPEARPTANDVHQRLGADSATGPTAIINSPGPDAPTVLLAAATVESAVALGPGAWWTAHRRLMVGLGLTALVALLVLTVASLSRHPQSPKTAPPTSVAPTTTRVTAQPTTTAGPATTGVLAACSTLQAQRAALAAEQRSIDQDKGLTPPQRDAAHKTLDAQRHALDKAQSSCGPPPRP